MLFHETFSDFYKKGTFIKKTFLQKLSMKLCEKLYEKELFIKNVKLSVVFLEK